MANEIPGLCSICGKPSPMFTCHLCGALVCNSCFDHQTGACKKCKMR